ncbi:endonuclease/exonuclease/phosphatase family protein [Parabacteroides sp. Marseille-P3160]|uniref:endonuclease/exonuclease/phosphatase family protein n=1 Tax=Parabacteroides sp. Marseille-P3160 TaxID=1917887 RepID=UPI0009BBA40A|nr:endonuclease/exonuclease/phosphatase family protein [Parabacteroides sp. Marseille-P3160]
MKKIIWSILFFFLIFLFSTAQKADRCTLNVASFNIRYDNNEDGSNQWKYRKDLVISLIRFYDFDVFGIQEGLIHQVKAIEEMGLYDRIGVGRDDGKEDGEHACVFYKKNQFELLDSGDFWLSETPDKPSLGWDALCRRVCSWVKLREIGSEKVFFFFNVHFDHRGNEARIKSADLILKTIKQIVDKTPTILVGDFNGTIESNHIKILKNDGLFSDSRDISQEPPYGTEGTINQFQVNPKVKARIDYIFLTKNIKVNKYATLNDTYYDRLLSDHYPIFARITF